MSDQTHPVTVVTASLNFAMRADEAPTCRIGDPDWLGNLDGKKAEAQKSAFFDTEKIWSAPM